MPSKDSISLGLGLGSIGTSLIGGALNAWSTHKTNQMNMKIAQMNNEFNEAMLERQMDFSREMWNAENEYNSPANQMELRREAGLNPYMIDDGYTGTASSPGSVGMPTASPVQFTAPQFDTGTVVGAIGQLGNLMTNGFLARQQGVGQQIENQYAEAMNQAKLALMFEQINETGFKAKKSGLEWQLMNDTYDNLALKTQLENDYLQSSITVNKAQAAVMQWDAKLKEVELAFLPQEKQAELAIRAQELVNLQLQGKISEQQCKLMIAQTLATYKSVEAMDSRIALDYSERAVNASEAAKNWNDVDASAPDAVVGRESAKAYDKIADKIHGYAIEQFTNNLQRESVRIPYLEGISNSVGYSPGDYVRSVQDTGGSLLKFLK